jgi:hypothetical protein
LHDYAGGRAQRSDDRAHGPGGHGVTDGRPVGGSNGSKPDLSRSRFFCNNARKGSLVCGILAFAALVIGGGFAEISSNGAPTSTETAVIRWIIVGSLVIGVTLYIVGGRILRADRDGGR